MSKKSKRPGRKPGGHLSSVPSANKMPLQLALNLRVVDSLTPDFVHWFEGGIGEAADAMQCLEVVRLFLTTGQALGSGSTATHLQEADLEEVAETLAGTLAGDDDGILDGLYDALHVYVDYLKESGQWTGSQQDYDHVHALLSDETDDNGPDLPDIKIPELTDEEQLRAFSELPLIKRTTRLLEWIGAGKDVTSTGALRLKDIEAAAAAVGVEAKGRKNAKRPLELWEGDEENLSAVLEVGSMHDVPVLREIWLALAQSGILSVGATRAVPGAEAAHWNSKDLTARIRNLRVFLTAFLVDALTTSGGFWSNEPELDNVLAMVLVKGSSAEPLEVSEIADMAENGAGGDIFMTIAAMRARPKLADLAELGLITAGTHYTVPPVVIGSLPPAIALVLMEVDEDFAAEEFGDDPDFAAFAELTDGDGEAYRATAAAPPSNVIHMRDARPAKTAGKPVQNDSTFQLKIQLKGSTPPVWRRVLVPASMRLSELHEVIQTVFDWEDYHLHSFDVGGRRGTRYGPRGDDGMRDEARTALHAVLAKSGDKLDYVYDFGDDWVHVITLEKVLDGGDGQELPRCTGGRGLAPAEDSGGVWGWADKVAIANDPAHEDHEEIREWLGLAPDETLDPKAFDVELADEELDDLR
ncbi:plasmid pRiA4b ORF-3 family protein [Arthrobacter cavernae]|uniref:Plasmid pRiA4b ORF-3 family protein n=1 Tax=Arthrobacter cavernae TaxID=2817681 RepID=A0A939HKI4_9MICC|nr:plasmid pRiA4b ORF-3 family protein [Arthrobacter cavernae]MBO1269692.1 plasmid pRiA4b ORF-3 family protein [Arthrobacter cavernae]